MSSLLSPLFAPTPYLVELKDNLRQMIDACGNLAQGADLSATIPVSPEFDRRVDQIHEISARILPLIEPQREPTEPRKHRCDSAASFVTDSSVELTLDHPILIDKLLTNITEMDRIPYSAGSTTSDPSDFIIMAKNTAMLSRQIVSLLDGTSFCSLGESKSTDSLGIASPSFTPPKAIIGHADDDGAVIRSFSRMVSSYIKGKIFKATSGKETEQNLLPIHGKDLELLFLDNNMLPGKSGMEIIKIIRSDPDWSKITVIFLTSDETFAQIKDVTSPDGSLRPLRQWEILGFDAFLVKPATQKMISKCVKETFIKLANAFALNRDNPSFERRWITNNPETIPPLFEI